MPVTPEEKEEIYRNTNIIHQDDDYLIVEPLSKSSLDYYGGPEIVSNNYSRKYRDGKIILIINTKTSPTEVISFYYDDSTGKFEFFDNDGVHLMNKDYFFDKIPQSLMNKVESLVIENTTYGRLLRLSQGEDIDFIDPLVTKIKYNKTSPKKTSIIITFDDSEDYFKTIGITEEDMWIFDTVFGNYYYNEGLGLFSTDLAYEEFKEGYLFRHFSDENMSKLNEIIKYISPQNYNYQPENEWGEIVADKMLELFGNECDDIIDSFHELENDCRDEQVKRNLIDDTCDIFNNYAIFMQTCFTKYFTSVGLLMSAYKRLDDKTISIGELLHKIAEPKIDYSFSDMIYDTYCYENFDEKFNTYVERSLDKIIEKIEDSDEFLDLKGFDELYNQIISKYGVNKYSIVPKDPEKKFRILSINPSKNKIVIEVVNWDTNEFEKRELDIEEFNNFLYTGELF
jgi:hypothetical protein